MPLSRSEQLQALTLRYTRDLSALQERRDRDLERIDRKKGEMLKSIPGADRHSALFQKSLTAARDAFETAAGKEEEKREAAKQKAREARYDADAKNEDQYGKALLRARKMKTAGIEKAEVKYREAAQKAMKAKDAGSRWALLRAARQAQRSAIEAANAEYRAAVAQAAETRKEGFDRIIEEEHARASGAERAYRTALVRLEKKRVFATAKAEMKLLQSLLALPGASAIVTRHEKEKLEIERRSDAKKSALTKRFRADLAKLKKKRTV